MFTYYSSPKESKISKSSAVAVYILLKVNNLIISLVGVKL